MSRHENQRPMQKIQNRETGWAWRYDQSKPAPVTIKSASGANVVIPPHVRVQVGPAWTHDPRYAVEPGKRIIGEYTAEWRQRRS